MGRHAAPGPLGPPGPPGPPGPAGPSGRHRAPERVAGARLRLGFADGTEHDVDDPSARTAAAALVGALRTS